MRKFSVGFLRGADFSTSIGVSDWRIALYMPEYGFETWIFGKGEFLEECPKSFHFIKVAPARIPLPQTIPMSYQFVGHASNLSLDVIICNPSLAMASGVIKKSNPNTKFILDIRSIPVETLSLAGVLNRLNFYCSVRCNHFDAITCISQEMLDEIIDNCHVNPGKQMRVWGSGYDPVLFDPSIDASSIRQKYGWTDKFIVMFHGTLSHSRGLFEAIRSLTELINLGIEDVIFVIVGQGNARKELSEYAKSISVDDHVYFLPPVPHRDIPHLVAACDMGIDPLPDHPWWRHQSSLKVFEYLAMGKPVLATDIPCHRGISDAVWIVPDNSPILLANGILDYRGLSEKSKSEIQKEAISSASEYSWRARAGILADFIYTRVL